MACAVAATCLRAQTPVPTSPTDAAAHKARHHEKMMRKYDVNGDGKLDANERAAMQADRAARLKKYDTNGNGRLDPNERAAMHADRKAQRKAAKAAGVVPAVPAPPAPPAK